MTRKEVIEKLRYAKRKYMIYKNSFADAIDAAVKELSADEWVPCGERMPSEDGHYLVTLDFDYGRAIEMGWLLGGEWVNENSHVTIAWQPLPEPYKGGK